MLIGTVPNGRKNHVFHRDVLLLWNIFAVLNLINAKRSDGEMVNWKTTTTLLEEKNLFSILRIYEQVVFLSRFHNRQVWSRPGIPPFPPPTLTKAGVLPLKLHIVRKVRNIEL